VVQHQACVTQYACDAPGLLEQRLVGGPLVCQVLCCRCWGLQDSLESSKELGDTSIFCLGTRCSSDFSCSGRFAMNANRRTHLRWHRQPHKYPTPTSWEPHWPQRAANCTTGRLRADACNGCATHGRTFFLTSACCLSPSRQNVEDPHPYLQAFATQLASAVHKAGG
jgi:hypothetical protein